MSQLVSNLCMCLPKRSAMQSPCPRCSRKHRLPMIIPMIAQMVSQRVVPIVARQDQSSRRQLTTMKFCDTPIERSLGIRISC